MMDSGRFSRHIASMHSNERETVILSMLASKGFVSFRELESSLDSSPATIRRDLEKLSLEGKLERVRGGAKRSGAFRTQNVQNLMSELRLDGVPFDENVTLNQREKQLIGKAAAGLCREGEAIMIDGGSTTLQMCSHLDGLGMQVLTNSLYIVLALLPQSGTRILVPGGAIFREQNIILSVFGDDCMPRYHAPRLFMGAAAIGRQGLMQEDIVLVAGERRFIERADEIIVLADATKFDQPSGNVVCPLEQVHTIVTDARITDKAAGFVESAGVNLIIADQ